MQALADRMSDEFHWVAVRKGTDGVESSVERFHVCAQRVRHRMGAAVGFDRGHAFLVNAHAFGRLGL